MDDDGQTETVSQIGTLPELSIYEWVDDGLMYSHLPDFIESYYEGNYNEPENEIRFTRLISGKVGKEERYKYAEGMLHRVK